MAILERDDSVSMGWFHRFGCELGSRRWKLMTGIQNFQTIKKQVLHELTELENLCQTVNDTETIKTKLRDIENLLDSDPANEEPFITAQISLYPLKQKDIARPITGFIQVLKEHELDVVPGAMSTVIAGKEKVVWNALHTAFLTATKHGDTVMLFSVSNACPWPHKDIYSR